MASECAIPLSTEQLKDLLAKVTPGDWRVVDGSESGHCCFNYTITSDDADGCGSIAETLICETDADATLIALAPTLAAEVVRLREQLLNIAELSGWASADDLGDIARQALDATATHATLRGLHGGMR